MGFEVHRLPLGSGRRRRWADESAGERKDEKRKKAGKRVSELHRRPQLPQELSTFPATSVSRKASMAASASRCH